MRCPACTEVLAENATYCGCGWKKPKASPAEQQKERVRELASQVREAFERNAPKAADLSEQQWYNVCRFFPFVAEHVNRERPEIGPSNPLHATSRMGMFARLRVSALLREPGEEG